MFGCDLAFGSPQSKSRDLRGARFSQFPLATRFDTLWAKPGPTLNWRSGLPLIGPRRAKVDPL
jgi:hypothetical protein